MGEGNRDTVQRIRFKLNSRAILSPNLFIQTQNCSRFLGSRVQSRDVWTMEREREGKRPLLVVCENIKPNPINIKINMCYVTREEGT